jgi:hypothetical protein
MANVKTVKEDRSLLVVVILSTLTLGIYELWYIHRLAKDVNVMCEEYGKRTSGIVPYILLSLITFGGYRVFWWYRVADMITYAGKKRDVEMSLSPSFVMLSLVLGYFIWGIAGWVAYYGVFKGANALAEDYNRKFRTKSYLDAQRKLDAEQL